MALVYTLAGQPETRVDVDDALGVLVLLDDRADGKLRRSLGLPAKATLRHALAKQAGLPAAELAPLSRMSSGDYTAEDYLAQFSEDWEREEYGSFADEVVRRNLAAWQAPAPLLAALDAALGVLADEAFASAVLPEVEGREPLLRLRQHVAEAMERGAERVCLEIDELA